MDQVTKVAKAKELGAAAFAAGKMRVPAWDADLALLLPRGVGAATGEAFREWTAVAGAWLEAWDAANIAAPVEGL